MSVYVVGHHTIDTILRYLIHRYGDSVFSNYPVRPLQEAGYRLLLKEDQERLGRDMLIVNTASFVNLYDWADEDYEQVYTPDVSGPPPNIFQAYKSLECYLYNCSDADEDPLYLVLKEVWNRIGHEIIAELPQYKRSIWG